MAGDPVIYNTVYTNDGNTTILTFNPIVATYTFAVLTADIIDDYPDLIGYTTVKGSTDIEYSMYDETSLGNYVGSSFYIIQQSDLAGGGWDLTSE